MKSDKYLLWITYYKRNSYTDTTDLYQYMPNAHTEFCQAKHGKSLWLY